MTTPLRFTKTPVSIRTPAPEVGEHSAEVLQEYLGITLEEIARLRNQEVI